MSLCKCGCNTETSSGDFVPGHDQKLRIRLENEVGGVLEMERLIVSAKGYVDGDLTSEDFNKTVRKIFSRLKKWYSVKK